MSKPQFRLDFDQPTYFDEIVGRNPKEVHGSNCIAQHECEQQQSRAGREVVRALRHYGVAGTEEDRVLKLDLAPAGLGLRQGGGEVGNLDKAEVCGNQPETLGELSNVEALGAGNARHVSIMSRPQASVRVVYHERSGHRNAILVGDLPQ